VPTSLSRRLKDRRCDHGHTGRPEQGDGGHSRLTMGRAGTLVFGFENGRSGPDIYGQLRGPACSAWSVVMDQNTVKAGSRRSSDRSGGRAC